MPDRADRPTCALLITADDVFDFQLDLDDTLACTRFALGGCERVDVVALTTRYDMWIDDEGLYNHPVNPAATALARSFGFTFQPYHGPVLITGVVPDGCTIGLTSEQMAGLLKRLVSALDMVV